MAQACGQCWIFKMCLVVLELWVIGALVLLHTDDRIRPQNCYIETAT